MYTISIDEYGNFETEGTVSGKTMLLAGVLFDDCGFPNETEAERERIEAYYRWVVDEANAQIPGLGAKYPSALHYREYGCNSNSFIVGQVKKIVERTLGNFLKGEHVNDSLPLQERRGKYYVYAIVKSDRGMNSLLGGNVGTLARDDYAGNLYFHMSTRAVNRLVFHNPLIRIPDNAEFALNLATRTTMSFYPNDDKRDEFIENGFEHYDNNGGKRFKVANSDIYRTALAQEMIRTKKHGIRIKDFDVVSIRYNDPAVENMEFLYLADSICSILSYRNNRSILDSVFSEVNSRISKLAGEDRILLFGYDEADELYQRAYEFYENGDYYNALSLCYEGTRRRSDSGSVFDDFYAKGWFARLISDIQSQRDERCYTAAVKRLNAEITTNRLDVKKNDFIFNKLLEMARDMDPVYDDAESRDVFYYLYDAGLSLACHAGDLKNARNYYTLCGRFSSRASTDALLRTRIRYAVALNDNMDYELSYHIIEEVIKTEKMVIAARNNICGNSDDPYPITTTPTLQKALSLQGQRFAYLHDPKAEGYFRMALEGWDKGSANYRITRFYLLHHYIDMKNAARYLEESRGCFGGAAAPEEQFDHIMENSFGETPLFNLGYALYVFIKGLYTFRRGDITPALRKKLCDLEGTAARYEERFSNGGIIRKKELLGYPYQLIYKYITLIEYACGNKDVAVDLDDRALHIVRDEKKIMRLINMACYAEIYDVFGFTHKRNKFIKSAGTILKNEFSRDIPEEFTLEELLKYVGYMYS